MIRIGLLGAAKITPIAVIEPAAQRNDCIIAAVACSHKTRGADFAKTHNIASVETDYETLITRDDIDLIYNALPPNRHMDLSIAALNAGKAVLCEKPFAMNAGQAKAMVAASAKTGCHLVEAFHYRFHPAFIRSLQLVTEGAVGAVQRIEACFDASIPYQRGELRHTASLGGGALMDLGCYPLHWARMLAASEPAVISASAQTGAHADIDIAMDAELEFQNGISAHISCSMQDGVPTGAEFTVHGDKGKLRMSNPLTPSTGHMISIEANATTTTEIVEGGPTYEYQLDHMMAVMLKKSTPLTGGQDAVANMTAIDAIYESAGMKPRG